ncbi:uncharacterized protein Bfra_010607 [Botrytis fragariae]|uniref:Uncharacterized protein n=1 Tax=Botrytis fragariae TaxID=1964551 RepID=A0A8H6ECP6_9HELO|nr:uncharacterized protein Bfra_010607 [Botrytis fragariae]KAF5867632.1 hypothetical protein Bfra_010607 [Botrytis fragariae]
MTDSNISNDNTEPRASQGVENDKKRVSGASNAPQESPQTPQSGPIEKEKPAKDRLEEDIAHHRSALYYGPDDPNARFWGILATSRRNRSVNRVSENLQRSECASNQKAESETHLTDNEMRKRNTLSNVSSGEKLGKVGFGAEPLHSPESNIAPKVSRHNAVTIVEVYELLLASCARVLSRFRAKQRKNRTI